MLNLNNAKIYGINNNLQSIILLIIKYFKV